MREILRHKKELALSLLFALLLTTTARGEIKYDNIRFKQLTIAEKLPNSTIYSITQDESGYMWFGTRSGLCKYDGYDLTTFYHDPNDSTSLCSNFVNSLFDDPKRGRLWIVTEDGMSSYDHQTERFTHYEIEGNTMDDNRFVVSQTGDLLTNSSVGVYRFDDKFDRFIPLLFADEGTNVDRIACDLENRLWIKTGGRLRCYDLSLGEFVSLPHLLKPFERSCRRLFYLSNNKLVIRSDDGSYIYDITSDRLSKLAFSVDIDDISCAEVDHVGNVWIGSEYGIFVFDGGCREIAHFEQRYGDLSSLNDSPIYTIYRDRSDEVWVGTYFGGVNYYVVRSDQFRIYPYGGSSNHLSGKAVREVVNSPDGGLYIATEDGGLNYMSAKREITRSEELNAKVGLGDAKNVHSLLITENRYLWVGLFMRGLVRYDMLTGESVDYDSMIPGISVFSILEDSNGDVWFGGPNGLYLIDKDDYMAPKRALSLRVHTMIQLDEHTILAGTRKGGLQKVDIERVEATPHDILSLPDLHITSIYRDSNGKIWVGANNDRLYLLDSEANLISEYTKDDLGSGDIKGIVEDNQNNIWVGSGAGLCRINPASREVSRYSVANGLPSNQFNFASACKRGDGELVFGTINGMISFYPNEVRKRESEFGVLITNIIDGRSEDRSVEDVTLTSSEAQSLTINYSGLNYQYSDNTLYAMKMEGIDNDWQYVGTQHQVRFSNLSAGEYTLRIKASGDGVTWDEKGATSLAIKVLPPWWLSTWAYILYLLLVALAIYLFIHFTRARLTLEMRLRSEQERRVNIEQLNQQKINFFTYVSHDLRTPLTLILSPLKQMIDRRDSGEMIGDEEGERLEIIYRNACRMNLLIDELLTLSKIEMQQMKMNLRRGDIMSFLRSLSAIFDITAEEREIEFEVDLESGCDEVWFSPSKLERIIYNLLSNAFKYTPNGGSIKLSARIIEAGRMVRISVKDSGRGIARELQPKIFDSYYQVDNRDQRVGFGLGLSLVKSLVLLHKGQINVVSEQGQGSEFVVTLDVSRDSYSESEYSIETISTQEFKRHNQSLQQKIDLLPPKLEHSGEDARRAKPKILIVEDNPDMNSYIADIFANEFEVVRAYNGADGCRLLDESLPDIIVSDVMMPEMDGLQFTKRVKESLRSSHIPVILLTAKSETLEQREGYLVGADGYITKPFDAENLKLLVTNLQRSRALSIERFNECDQADVELITNSSRDSEFMHQVVDLIMENLSNDSFGVAEATAELGVSRSLLHNKLKSLSGVSFTQFVRSLKMKEAKAMLARGMNISEVTFAIGMSDPSYFTKCFKREFHTTPTEFIRDLRGEG
ncbi:MAG: two-component regulator propeller domain-containing protein [Rikenellaceae bacterium]